MATGTTIPNVRRQTKQFAPIEAQIQRAIARIADSDCPVLIMGEHGVGKRSIAAQIHSQSHRSRSAYTEIHSAEADVEALASAFSTKGTVYLSEVGDLSLSLQELIIKTYFHSAETLGSRLLCGTSRVLIDRKSTRLHSSHLV